MVWQLYRVRVVRWLKDKLAELERILIFEDIRFFRRVLGVCVFGCK